MTDGTPKMFRSRYVVVVVAIGGTLVLGAALLPPKAGDLFARANSPARSAEWYAAHPAEEAEALKACSKASQAELEVSPPAECSAVFAADAKVRDIHNDRRKFLTGSSGSDASAN